MDTTALATQAPFNLCSLFCLPLCCLPPMPTSQEFFVLPFYRTCLFSLLLSPSLVDNLSLCEKERLGQQDGSEDKCLLPKPDDGFDPQDHIKGGGRTASDLHTHPPTRVQVFSPLNTYTQERNSASYHLHPIHSLLPAVPSPGAAGLSPTKRSPPPHKLPDRMVQPTCQRQTCQWHLIKAAIPS